MFCRIACDKCVILLFWSYFWSGYCITIYLIEYIQYLYTILFYVVKRIWDELLKHLKWTVTHSDTPGMLNVAKKLAFVQLTRQPISKPLTPSSWTTFFSEIPCRNKMNHNYCWLVCWVKSFFLVVNIFLHSMW